MMMRMRFAALAVVCVLGFAGCPSVPATPNRTGSTPATMIEVSEIARQLKLEARPDSAGNILVLSGPRGTVVFNPKLRGILIANAICFPGHRVVLQGTRVSVPTGFIAECEKRLGPAVAEQRPAQAAQPTPPPPTGWHIVIDPGHGGNDPGAIGASGTREKTVNLSVAHAVAERLRARGIRVTLTRYGDEFIDLNDRAGLANRLGADAFISIHADSSSDRSVRGFTVFVVHPRYSDASRAAMISAECGMAPGALESVLARNRARSSRLAALIRAELDGVTGSPDRGTQLGAFRVLKRTMCPAALIELGFLSSPSEEQRLVQGDYQGLLATAIANGVARFLSGG